MKKILLSSALLAALSTSAFAESGNAYFRLDGGYSFVSSPATSDFFENKLSTANMPFINLGLGYYASESVRVDLNFTYHFNYNTDVNTILPGAFSGPLREIVDNAVDFPNFIPRGTLNIPAQALVVAVAADVRATRPGMVAGDALIADAADVAAAARIGRIIQVGDELYPAIAASKREVDLVDIKKIDVQSTFKMFSVMPRVYFDLWDYGNGKLFAGVGLGYANLQNQVTLTARLAPITAARIAELQAPELNRAPLDRLGPDATEVAHPVLATAVAANYPDSGLTFTSPAKGNFAFSLHAGMDYKIPSMEGVKLNFEASYANYGQVKTITIVNRDVTLPNPLKFNMVNVSLGLRIEM